MLSREEVFDIIEAERAYQDTNYDPNFITSSGLTRKQRDQDVSAGILMLSAYIRKAEAAWVDDKKGDNLPALQQVAKIAAIAVRVLERAGGSQNLLRGLR